MTPPRPHLIPLAAASDPNLAGRKAAALAGALEAGFRVPAGVVVPAGTALDEGLGAELRAALDDLGGIVAVRSSGLGEDTEAASYAGQYETILDVSDGADLVAAVHRCLASATAAPVAAYRERIHADAAPMAVLVQRMLAPEASGVAFSIDPLSGADRVVIEATSGIGDSILAGTTTPERWTVASAPELEAAPNAPALDPEQAATVATLCRNLARHAGHPVDIEWALAKGELHLLQVRPITRAPLEPSDRPPPQQTWLREPRFSEPVTPLAFSAWLPHHQRAFEILFERLGMPLRTVESRRYYGHVYTRAAPLMDAGTDGPTPPSFVLRLLFRLAPPLRQRMAAAATLAANGYLEGIIDAWEGGGRERLRSRRRQLRQTDPTGLDDTALAAQLDAILDHVLDSAITHFELAFGAVFIATGRLGMFVEEVLGWGQEETIGLLQGFGHGATEHGHALRQLAAELDLRIVERAQAEPGSLLEHAAAERYLERFGHRLASADLARPTEAEDPTLLAQHLARHLPSSDPAAADSDHTGPRETAHALEARARARLSDPHDLKRFEAHLTLARRGRPYGDETEGDTLEALALVRYLSLEAASRLVADGRLRQAEDVWFLTVDELGTWLRQPGAPAPDIEQRRREHMWALANPVPERLGPAPAPPPRLDVVPARARPIVGAFLWAMQLHDPAPSDDHGRIGNGAFAGTPGSPGRGSGTVRVIRDASEFHRVRPGDVVVCPTTMASWSPIFGIIAGLVTERGGLLSHPATLAREFGLPAVLALPNATSILPEGAQVVVDGGAGTVTLLGRSVEAEPGSAATGVEPAR